MTERTYPREWFAVYYYQYESSSIVARIFDRETSARLYTGKVAVNKTSDWRTFYPTRAEAEAALAKRVAAKAKSDADKRLRDAAPELLAKGQALVDALDKIRFTNCNEALDEFRAAIAKAKGQ